MEISAIQVPRLCFSSLLFLSWMLKEMLVVKRTCMCVPHTHIHTHATEECHTTDQLIGAFQDGCSCLVSSISPPEMYNKSRSFHVCSYLLHVKLDFFLLKQDGETPRKHWDAPFFKERYFT